MSHAQKMEIVGRLAEGMTHEINNLMTVVTINAELLRNRVEPQDSDPLAQILEAANQAASLSRRLLAFGQPVGPVRAAIDLNGEIEVLERLVRPLLGGHVELELVPCPDLAPIEADRSEIGQLVMTLILNAKDAVSTGGRIVVETFNTLVREREPCHTGSLAAGAYVGLRVSGAGGDVDAETLSRIFEPFFSARNEAGPGGQGLAMVRALATRSGGGVRVSSAPGRGVCVEVLLPARAPTRCLFSDVERGPRFPDDAVPSRGPI